MMEREYIIGDMKTELEEIERMNEKNLDANDIYRFTNDGPFLTLLCC